MTFFENSQPFWIYSPWKRASKYWRPNEFSKQKYYFEFMTKMQKKNIFKWKYAETMDASPIIILIQFLNVLKKLKAHFPYKNQFLSFLSIYRRYKLYAKR